MQIRKMKKHEEEAVSHMLANAFYGKFQDKTRLTKKQLQKLLKLVWIQEADSFSMTIFTVQAEGEVVGAFGCSTSGQFKPGLRLLAKTAAIIKAIGPKAFVSFVKAGLSTSRNPAPNEWYIDFIAVKESHRNQSIGHDIMDYLTGAALSDPEIDNLTLYVLKGNDRAKHLYEKYGFIEQYSKPESDYHFMKKVIRY
jgi:ribosomal protein S18 acetylase RimI-like enzyme